jgi:hypothetical protein
MKKINRLGTDPMFSNGRTTKRSYLVVAIRPSVTEPNAVGLKKIGHDHYKFHFWSNEKLFNVELDEQAKYYREDGGYSNLPYVGIMLNREETIALLDQIKSCRGVKVANRDHVMEVLDSGAAFDPNQHTCIDDLGVDTGPSMDDD